MKSPEAKESMGFNKQKKRGCLAKNDCLGKNKLFQFMAHTQCCWESVLVLRSNTKYILQWYSRYCDWTNCRLRYFLRMVKYDVVPSAQPRLIPLLKHDSCYLVYYSEIHSWNFAYLLRVRIFRSLLFLAIRMVFKYVLFYDDIIFNAKRRYFDRDYNRLHSFRYICRNAIFLQLPSFVCLCYT